MGESYLRLAGVADLEELAALVALEEKSSSWNLAAFKAELNLSWSRIICLCIKQDFHVNLTSIVGFIVYWVIAEEMEILNLLLASAYRRQGYGSKLLTAALQAAKSGELAKISLELRPDNLAAYELYRKFGFKVYGQRCAYYPDGKDAWLMEKILK